MPKANHVENTVPAAEETAKKTAVVNCDRLNVRKKPSLDAEVLTVISRNDSVTIMVEKDNSAWVKVTLTTGQIGYCMKEFLR